MMRDKHKKGGVRKKCDGSETPLNPLVHFYDQIGNQRYCDDCHRKQDRVSVMVHVEHCGDVPEGRL